MNCLVAASMGYIIGIAAVVDGDTLRIGDACIRLHGIDAPELAQTCERSGGTYRRGEEAATYLDTLVEERTVSCRVRARHRDRYVADCEVGGLDLGMAMVSAGWALDWPQYSKGFYSAHQEFARMGKAGMWSGKFIEPWAWRRGK